MIRLIIEIDDMPDVKEAQPTIEKIESDICEVVAKQGYSAELVSVEDDSNGDIYNCEDGWRWT